MAIFRDRPSPAQDSTQDATPGRIGRYFERYVLPISNKEMFACDEGSSYLAINPTTGTGIIGHAAPTTFDETKPYLSIFNAGTKRVYPQFLLLTDTVISAGGTRMQFTFAIDNINRYSSGGTALTLSNTNMDSSNTSSVTAYAGAVTAAAASANRRLLGNHVLRGANVDVVWDTYEFVFGAAGGATSVAATQTTTAGHYTRMLSSVCIGPGQSLLVHQWQASQSTGPTFEVQFGYIER